jgi:hypothetical protein
MAITDGNRRLAQKGLMQCHPAVVIPPPELDLSRPHPLTVGILIRWFRTKDGSRSPLRQRVRTGSDLPREMED